MEGGPEGAKVDEMSVQRRWIQCLTFHGLVHGQGLIQYIQPASLTRWTLLPLLTAPNSAQSLMFNFLEHKRAPRAALAGNATSRPAGRRIR